MRLVAVLSLSSLLLLLTACDDADAVLEITNPPSVMVDGASVTFTLTYTRSGNIGERRAFQFSIYESDTGFGTDDLLRSNVEIAFEPTEQTKTTTFTLTCSRDGSSWDLQGTGRSDDEDTHTIYAEGSAMLTSGDAATSGLVSLTCTRGVISDIRLTDDDGDYSDNALGAGTRTLTAYVDIANALSSTVSWQVEIWEWDVWPNDDDRLITSVSVPIAAGATTGSTPVESECELDVSEWDLVGTEGRSDDENWHQVYSYHRETGKRSDSPTTTTRGKVVVRCVDTALSMFLTTGGTRINLANGASTSVTLTVRVATAPTSDQSFNIDVEEYDSSYNDTLVDDLVVTVRAGQTSGSATASLTCTVDGAPKSDLAGPDGTSEDEETHWVVAEIDSSNIRILNGVFIGCGGEGQ
ncbi:MAG: hypothetical protein O2971_12405 [Proteobacteria bacterium]|nr:hypothetical protein [Pseudomonadota bacterium]